MATRTVLITGATGKQGGAVIDALLKANAKFEIIALTRNASSPAAQKVLRKSPQIKLVTGDFATIREVFDKAKEVASAPIWGVFSVQAVTKNEEQEGKNLIDASLENGVSHFVYTSADRGVNSDVDPTNVPHFVSKYNIEQHLITKAKASGTSWTILRPVAFMDNLSPDFFGKVFTTSWLLRLGQQDKTLQLIASSDIGYFAAQSFLNPDSKQYQNRSFALAGDELTFSQFKEAFERTTGETLPTTYMFIARALNWMSKELGYMFTWFREVGFGADIAHVREMKPGMKDFKTWLETESAWKKK